MGLVGPLVGTEKLLLMPFMMGRWLNLQLDEISKKWHYKYATRYG